MFQPAVPMKAVTPEDEAIKKPGVITHVGLGRKIMPAATYSPTQFPMQYHRRYEA